MKSSRPSQNGFRDSLQYSDIPSPGGARLPHMPHRKFGDGN